MPNSYLIANHGHLRWISDREDAGPYYLTWGRMAEQVLASFGTRSVAVSKPMSATQREAFYTSRAAFVAIRDAVGADLLDFEQTRELVKVAAKIARSAAKTWGIGQLSSPGFERQVARKFEAYFSPPQ